MQRLTLGIELEVIADARDLNEPPQALRERIAAAINAAGNATARETKAYTPGETAWVIAQDGTITPDPSLKPRRYGVEIISPPFIDLDDPSRDIWHGAVSHVMQVVTSAFKISTNDSTGYHVHIGIGKGPDDRFTLEEIKKISLMVLIYEPVIDKMHPSHRSENSQLESNRDNWFIEWLGRDAPKWLLNASSICHVEKMMCPLGAKFGTGTDGYPIASTREYKVNLLSLNKYGTIEFRQHAGTYDVSAICQWADFLLLFIRKALALSFDEILAKDSVHAKLSDIVSSEAHNLP